MNKHEKFVSYLSITILYLITQAKCFTSSKFHRVTNPSTSHFLTQKQPQAKRIHKFPTSTLSATNDYKEKEEEARLKILKARRKQIRSTLKSAEQLRNYRIANGLVAETKEEQSSEQSKLALGITAFFVAMGAIVLRVGGRAALVSAIGLDFTNDNPELQTQLQSFLDYTNELDFGIKTSIFILGWCFVKVFCFDLGGVVLALSSGILFDNVILGAIMSAGSATIGSIIAFLLAKIDTPIRSKALQLVEEYPSLRGIEKVVAQDGIKAILTLRLAPILPIPIGMYNYVYGITNVPISDFAIGIFLGSLKPYLLDSYLGYFGKSVLSGSSDNNMEDALLLVILGVSILIGVFASQLATETWETVQQEVEKEKLLKDDKEDDGIIRNIMGLDMPQWVIGLQLTFQQSLQGLDTLIESEYEAKVWNYTKEEEVPPQKDPVYFSSSPEVSEKYKGIDFGLALCDGFALGFVLLQTFLKYSDPLFVETKDVQVESIRDASNIATNVEVAKEEMYVQEISNYDEVLLTTLSLLKNKTLIELENINNKLDNY